MKKPTLRRPGMVMLMALLVISLAAVSAALCAQQHIQVRRQSVREAHARQAQWLAESALSRARAALADDANYEGETWQPESDVPAQAIIVVTKNEADQSRQITIDAQYPADPVYSVRHQRTFVLPEKSQP